MNRKKYVYDEFYDDTVEDYNQNIYEDEDEDYSRYYDEDDYDDFGEYEETSEQSKHQRYMDDEQDSYYETEDVDNNSFEDIDEYLDNDDGELREGESLEETEAILKSIDNLQAIDTEAYNNEEVLKKLNELGDKISDVQKGFILDDLCEKNFKLVHFVANSFTSNIYTHEDLYAAGLLGFAKALKRYDISKGVKLTTFAVNCCRNEIRYFLRKENKYNNNTVSMNTIKHQDKNGNDLTIEDTIADRALTPDEDLEKQIVSNVIAEAIKELSPIDRFVMTLRFGLDRGKELTQKEIAEYCGMSQANVSKIERNCLEKLREIVAPRI